MLYVKRTWHKCTDPKVVAIFNEVKDRAKELYPACFNGCDPELYIDSSTKHLGRCTTQYTRPYTKREACMAANANKIRYSRAVILLSKYIVKNHDIVRATLCHEFGHFVSPTQKHNYLFLARADRIGEKWGITNSTYCSKQDAAIFGEEQKMAGVVKEEYKYSVGCPKCNGVWRRKRMCDLVKSPESYRCPKCGVALKRII